MNIALQTLVLGLLSNLIIKPLSAQSASFPVSLFRKMTVDMTSLDVLRFEPNLKREKKVRNFYSRNHSDLTEIEVDNEIECGIFCSRNVENCNSFHFSSSSKNCLGGFACIGEFQETKTSSSLDIYQLGLKYFCGKISKYQI